MAWTNIPDDVLEPGKPIRSVDAIALRDNPIAIAQGLPGAPRILTAALQPPVAGDTHVLWSQNSAARTGATSYILPELHRYSNPDAHIGVLCLVPGTIRCSLEHRATSSVPAAGAPFVRILRNGIQLAEWFTESATFVARTLDVEVALGDQVIFQQRRGNQVSPEWRNLRVSSANPNMAVA